MIKREKKYDEPDCKRNEVIAKIDELIDNKWYGGIELKIENGNIDYLKSWRGQKF